LHDPILAAEAFNWLGRRTVAVATTRSVYIGWRNDSQSKLDLLSKYERITEHAAYRELVRLQSGVIRMISVVQDFGWLLVLISGNLLAFSLREMMPASDPATWVMLGQVQARVLSDPEKIVAFVRVGFTKGRLMGEFSAGGLACKLGADLY
jgi:hypothetical protein